MSSSLNQLHFRSRLALDTQVYGAGWVKRLFFLPPQVCFLALPSPPPVYSLLLSHLSSSDWLLCRVLSQGISCNALSSLVLKVFFFFLETLLL